MEAQSADWQKLGLSAATLELVAKAGYTTPTPVQAEAVPLALQGRDLIASAQTGTGKTACFVLPMIEKFIGREGTFGVVLCPTREIAQRLVSDLSPAFPKPARLQIVPGLVPPLPRAICITISG